MFKLWKIKRMSILSSRAYVSCRSKSWFWIGWVVMIPLAGIFIWLKMGKSTQNNFWHLGHQCLSSKKLRECQHCVAEHIQAAKISLDLWLVEWWWYLCWNIQGRLSRRPRVRMKFNFLLWYTSMFISSTDSPLDLALHYNSFIHEYFCYNYSARTDILTLTY